MLHAVSIQDRRTECPFSFDDPESPCLWEDECQCMSGPTGNNCKEWFPDNPTVVYERCMERMREYCRRKPGTTGCAAQEL